MEFKKEFTTAHLEEIEGKSYFVASDDTVDREGEVISIDGWDLKNFKRNPILLWSHDPKEPIGVAESIGFKNINGKKKLVLVPKFHDVTQKAREIAELVAMGIINTLSVGFIGKEMSADGMTFLKQELLEVSFVSVPANPNATSLAMSKGISEETIKAVFKEEKSPACRMDGEEKDKCVARKIPEIKKENPDMSQEQCVAMAESMCSKACKKDIEEDIVEIEDIDEIEVEEIVNDDAEEKSNVILDKLSELSDKVDAVQSALDGKADKGRVSDGDLVKRLAVSIQKQSESLAREKNHQIINNVRKNIQTLAEILIKENKK